MMQSQLLGERWVLLADVSSSTRFFWELMQAGTLNPAALFEGSTCYAAHMESIFGDMANVCTDRLVAHLGNTMGDGFILVGRHGNGADHITKDAPRVLELARMVKTHCDMVLSAAKAQIVTLLLENSAPRDLPDLRMKVTLHHGYVVTMMQSQRFFGDTINYCARIASAAFDQWYDGVVLTKGFVAVLLAALREDVDSLEVPVKIRYPSRECTSDSAYRLATSNAAIWSRVAKLAGSVNG